MTDALLLAAGESLLSKDGILFVLGGAAGLLAMLGLLLLLPLYLTQRQEVERLLSWMDREPDAGTTEFRAIDPDTVRGAGGMTPAERVTSERPALARISTAEHDALALRDAPLWRRVIDRGPRHPLVIAILALLAAVAIVAAAGILIRSDDGDSARGGGIDRGEVQIAVVNASSTAGVADLVGDGLGDRGFDVVSTDVDSDPVTKTEVQFAPGQKKAGRLVVRTLSLPEKQSATEFDAEGEAAANGADIVIFVGEDLEVPAEGGGEG